MKRILLLAFLLIPFQCVAQTFTVGSTTQQLNPTQRGSVSTYWPDGNMGAIFHGGTNYVFSMTNNPGEVQVTVPNLNTWSSGLSVVNPATNLQFASSSNAFDYNYIGGQAVYYDSTSGYLIMLYHGENWGGCPSNCSASYAALGLAYSTDFGNTWHKVGEVVSPQAARGSGGSTCQADIGTGTLLVVGSYFYTYYPETPTGCTNGEQLAVARASITSVITQVQNPSSFPTSGPGTLFMKYTGGGNWTGNGVTDIANPQNGGGAFATIAPYPSFNGHGYYVPNVRYDSYLNQYVLTYTDFFNIALATSPDGLTWNNFQNVNRRNLVPPNAYSYPSLLNTSGGDPQVLGQNFSVFYVYPFGTWSNSSLYSVAVTSSGGGGGACGSASPYTAASAAESDVNSCINGPGHVAVNGDTIQIPCSGTQSVTWTSGLNITASITLTALGGTPNTGPSTFGSGTNCLTIVDDITSPIAPVFAIDPTYASSNNVTTLQNINIVPFSTSTTLYSPISLVGTATASGFPQVRIDNIQFGTSSVPWTESGNSSNAAYMIVQDDVIGVVDHWTIAPNSAVSLATTNYGSWLGVGLYGDNSWAQPDSMGTANEWYEENGVFNSAAYYQISDATEAGPSFSQSGGGRIVNRFNHLTVNDSFGITGVHGLDSTGRPRSGRHTETYGNVETCANSGGNCQAVASFRGGTGVVFGNTVTSSVINGIINSTHYNYALGNIPFGFCGGLNSASGGTSSPTFTGDPWDTVDNTVYYSGTMTTSGPGVLIMTDGSKSFPNLAPSGAPYSVYDTTLGFVSQVVSNTGTSITVLPLINQSVGGFNNGDSYEIIRATVCMDQGGRGQGIYISGSSPSPVSPINEALDPIYEWDDTIHGTLGAPFTPNYSGGLLADRDYYQDDWASGGLSGPVAQTGSTTPFNGSTTCNAGSGNYTCGVGFGILANRPTSCTAGVGYFATDQGSWNTSGNGFGQGVLYKCTAANTWTLSYVPYVYPHPLAGGSSPTESLTVTITGSGTGTITGLNCSTGSYVSGTTVSCTATTTGGSTLSSLVGTGSVSCSGTICASTGGGLTSTSTVTATFAAGPPVCGDPTQNGPNFSGTYNVPPTVLPLSIGFTSPTSGCSMFMTLDGSTPTCSSTAYAGQSITSTTTMRVIACQATFTSSAVVGGTWTIVNITSAPTNVQGVILQGVSLQ